MRWFLKLLERDKRKHWCSFFYIHCSDWLHRLLLWSIKSLYCKLAMLFFYTFLPDVFFQKPSNRTFAVLWSLCLVICWSLSQCISWACGYLITTSWSCGWFWSCSVTFPQGLIAVFALISSCYYLCLRLHDDSSSTSLLSSSSTFFDLCGHKSFIYVHC